MKNSKDKSRIFTRSQVDTLLSAVIGQTLEDVDNAGLFKLHAGRDKVKGIAGDIIEVSVLGCNKDSLQEPDIIVDGELTEIKTTGMVKPKKSDSPYLFECKEPVSVTAVSIDKIVHEEFETSNFWHKLAHLLWVYYWYNSAETVKLEGYKQFPILGFQFYQFSDENKLLLRQDWLLVRDFLIVIQRDYRTKSERAEQYPRLSHELRGQLMLIDTAPKYPNPPRFRLKRSFATQIANQYFTGKKYDQLPQKITKYADIDTKCQQMTAQFQGKTFNEIADILGIEFNRDVKNFAEQVVTHMFGSKAKKLNDIEDFAKIGVIAKSVPLRATGSGKEDMKLFLPNLVSWTEEESFEDSAIYDYFAGHHFLFIIYQHTAAGVVFKGFKRIFFSEEFIQHSVRKVWEQVRNLISNRTLRLIREYDDNGEPIMNVTGSYREAPNFPKASENDVFVRGGASTSEDKHKTLVINGLRMMPQSIWLNRHTVLKLINENNA